MRRKPAVPSLCLPVLAGLLAMPAPALATAAPVAPQPAILSAGDLGQAVAGGIARAQAGDCKGALALLDPVVSGAQGAGAQGAEAQQIRTSAQLVRMPCLAESGRGAEVPKVLAELKAEAPDNPLVQGYQVFLDADDGHYAEAADGLGMLADNRSRALKLMPGQLWQTLAQRLTLAKDYARRDRVALSLAEADWQPSDQPDLPESLAADGIGSLVDRKDVGDARVLLDKIAQPELIWEMAIERRYASLWPDVEQRLGPQGGLAADRFAETALAAYAAGPADMRTTRDAARAFLLLGRYDDVASVAGSVAVQPGMSEEQVDTVLAHSRALAASGDRAGQVARLQPFATLDLRTTPDAATALISLAEALDEAGRYQDELGVARHTLQTSAGAFSTFGQAWLKRSELCALSGLGRAAEAKVAGDALKAAAADNQPAAVEGLLCAGRDGEAARIAIDTLSTDEGVDRIADQFQPDGAIYAPSPSRLRALWVRLLQRPDVKAAFTRSARILPKPLWPAAKPRDVPALRGGFGADSTT